MTNNNDFKDRVTANPEALIRAACGKHGVEMKPDGDHVFICCPVHSESTPSCHISLETGGWACFGCETTGDALTLVAALEGLSIKTDFPRVLEVAAELQGIAVPARREEKREKAPAVLSAAPTKQGLAEEYGLNVEDFDAAEFTFTTHTGFKDFRGQPVPAVCYPVYYHSGKTAQKYKSLARVDGKRLQNVSGSPKGELGLIEPCDLTIAEGSPVVLAGGEEKALAAIMAGFHAFALQNGEKGPSADQVARIASFKPSEVIIAYDADLPGRTGSSSACDAFAAAGIPARRVNWPAGTPEKYDLNDVLKNGGVDELRRILEGAESYKEPIPTVEAAETMPVFPLDVLPAVFGSFARVVTDMAQVPTDLSAMAVLAALSAAVGGKAQIHPRERDGIRWKEELNIYAACIAFSSERKSPPVDLATAPLHEYERQRRKDHEEKSADLKTKLKVLKLKLTQKAKAAKLGTPGVEEEMIEMEKEVEALEEKLHGPGDIILQDITPENLAIKMMRNGGVGAIIDSEPDLLRNFLGRYSKDGGSNLGLLLHSYNGETFKDSRVSREDTVIPRPVLTMFVTPQPSFIESLGAHDLGPRGFVGRFLWAMPSPRVGYRDSWYLSPDPEADNATIQHYNAAIMHIVNTQAEDKPWRLKQSVGAYRLFREYCEWIEPQLSGDLAGLKEWGGKSPGRVARIAALLHIARNFSFAWHKTEITESTMKDAIRVMREWAIPHAVAAHHLMRLSSAGLEADARTIWDALKKRKQTGETIVMLLTLQKTAWKLGMSGKAFEAAIEELESQRFIEIGEEKTVGRPKKVILIGPFEDKTEKVA